MNYLDLRQKYPKFVYKSFAAHKSAEALEINFEFQVSELIFKPSVRIMIPQAQIELDEGVINNFAFHLGLMEVPSYWKATCSPIIEIECASVDEYQINWWHEIIIKGMGQYFFENQIDFTQDSFLQIKSLGNSSFQNPQKVSGEKVLIPIGGGKDSAVTLQLINGTHQSGVFCLNPNAASKRLIDGAGVKEQIFAQRQIEPSLLELNNQGYLNGHTPFSAYLAFLGTFCAVLREYKYLALSNERSSNEGNTSYLGHEVNHQYSKTFEFENKFREYNNKYLSDVDYFSFLRPLHEIQIAKIFCSLPQYFSAIRSCNEGQKSDSWCGKCAKCLSTYILLSPFLTHLQLGEIFHGDLLADPGLKLLLEDLTNETHVKPFECVGTREELRAALNGSVEKLIPDWDEKNNLPAKFEELLRSNINA